MVYWKNHAVFNGPLCILGAGCHIPLSECLYTRRISALTRTVYFWPLLVIFWPRIIHIVRCRRRLFSCSNLTSKWPACHFPQSIAFIHATGAFHCHRQHRGRQSVWRKAVGVVADVTAAENKHVRVIYSALHQLITSTSIACRTVSALLFSRQHD